MIKNKKQNKNPNKQKKVKKKQLFSPDKPGNCLQETSVQLEGLYQEEILQETLHLAFNNFSKHKFRNSSYYHFQEVYP